MRLRVIVHDINGDPIIDRPVATGLEAYRLWVGDDPHIAAAAARPHTCLAVYDDDEPERGCIAGVLEEWYNDDEEPTPWPTYYRQHFQHRRRLLPGFVEMLNSPEWNQFVTEEKREER